MQIIDSEYVKTVSSEELDDLIRQLCGKEFFQFSIFKVNDDEEEISLTIPNIISNEPVLQGKVMFFIDYYKIPKEFSSIFENPTWKDIIVSCNQLLNEKEKGFFLEELFEYSQAEFFEKNPQKIVEENVRFIKLAIGS